MRRCLSLVFRGLLVAAVLVSFGCERSSTAPKPQTQAVATQPVVETASEQDDAPLLLDDAPLLLLDEPADAPASDHPAADNSRCFVCHANFIQEKIAVTHARANIGCADCHGPSDAHIADESWASGGNGTAPDIMFPRDTINRSCTTCHTQDKLEGPQHEALFATPPAAETQVCTDCHGDHRMAQRRCRWK